MKASELRDLEAAIEMLNRALKEAQEEREQLRGERDVLRAERNEMIASMNEQAAEVLRLTGALKITDCSNPYGCRRQTSFDEWHAKDTAEIERLTAERDKLLKATSPVHAHVDMLRAECDRLRVYADKLARGLPEGMLPKDIEVLREGNVQLATEVERLKVALDESEGRLIAHEQVSAMEVARLRAALAEAIEEVESWADYAGEYFKDKHDLAGTLKRLRAALAGAADQK